MDAASLRRTTAARFNEAAGIPRGRLDLKQTELNLQGASMRPRVFPAEDQVGEIRYAFEPELQ